MNTSTIHLNADLLQGVTLRTRAADWSERLQTTGLLLPRPNTMEQAWSPASGVAAIHDNLHALRIAEATLLDIQESSLVNRLPIPDAFWGVIMVALLGIILFANALVAWMGPMAVWGGIAFAMSVALFTVVDRRRQAAEVHAQSKRDAAAQALYNAISDIVERNFVAQLDGIRLINTPDLDRMRALEAALSISDPNVDLLQEIRATIAQTESQLAKLLSNPVNSWSNAGLAIDVRAYERAVDKL